MINLYNGIIALAQSVYGELSVLLLMPVTRGFIGGYVIATLIFDFIYSRKRRCNVCSKKEAIVVLALAFFLLPSFAFANMGISPPEVVIDDVLRDVPNIVTVRILREDSSQDQQILVSFDGEDSRFLQGDSEFFMPTGQSVYEYELTILATDASVGDYSARADFAPELPDVEATFGAGVAVRRGVSLIVGFSVTGEESVGYTIDEVTYFPVEENGDLTTRFDLINDGNVEWRPDSVVITITDPVTGEVVGTETIPGTDLDVLLPGESVTVSSLLDLRLPTGNYVASTDFVYGDEVVSSQESNLEVLESGTISQVGEFTKLKASKETYLVGEVAQLVGYFGNLGNTPYVGNMNIQLFDMANDSLYQTLTSNELSIYSQQSVIFEVTTVLDRVGDFRAVAFVDYGNKQSGTQIVNFKVERPPAVKLIPDFVGSGLNKWIIGIAGILLFSILIIFLFFIKKRNKRKPVELSPADVITSLPSGAKIVVTTPEVSSPIVSSPPTKVDSSDDDSWTVSL